MKPTLAPAPAYARDTTQRAEARRRLLRMLKPGKDVHTVIRHAGASGTRRSISAFVVFKGEIKDITYWAAVLLDDKTDSTHGGIICKGGGQDFAFDLVYRIGYALWPNGTRAKAAAHPHNARADGGYSLSHKRL